LSILYKYFHFFIRSEQIRQNGTVQAAFSASFDIPFFDFFRTPGAKTVQPNDAGLPCPPSENRKNCKPHRARTPQQPIMSAIIHMTDRRRLCLSPIPTFPVFRTRQANRLRSIANAA
jgi:hypothetical protein